MRRFVSAFLLALVSASAPRAHAQGLVPPPSDGQVAALDVPSPLLGLPVPLEVSRSQPGRGGPSARYAGDAAHQLVSAGYELLSNWFLLSGAVGYSVTPAHLEAETSTGLQRVERSWLQLGLGLGVAPVVPLLGEDGESLRVSLVPLLRVAGDLAFAFDDVVSPVRLRSEAGAMVLAGFDFGLRLGAGASFDYDLTHFADEKVGEAGTLRVGASVGWLLEETSTYAEDKSPTLLVLGVGAELAVIESPTRATGLAVTVGVSL